MTKPPNTFLRLTFRKSLSEYQKTPTNSGGINDMMNWKNCEFDCNNLNDLINFKMFYNVFEFKLYK